MNILAIGAHPDDVCGGCFGTLCKLKRDGNKLFYLILTLGEDGGDKWDRKKEQEEVAKLLNVEVIFAGLPSAHLSNDSGRATIQAIEQAILRCRPRVIFSHSLNDRHQDHSVLSDLTWNTFRNHLILEYEIPKYDGDLGQPNVFSRLDEKIARQKVNAILKRFPSQRGKHWFTKDALLGLMRVRGIECASKYAEGFYCRKFIL